jgi:hypothetical protein
MDQELIRFFLKCLAGLARPEACSFQDVTDEFG